MRDASARGERAAMKFCYVDETGIDGASPVVVMAGVTVDAVRLRRANRQFDDLTSTFFASSGRAPSELKGRDLHRGRRTFDGVDPDLRHALIDDVCRMCDERGLRIALAALDLKRLASITGPSGAPTKPLAVGGLHVALQLQRMYQGKDKNKDLTVLVFDENKRMVDVWSDLIHDPPGWSDAYYGRKKDQDQLSTIVDSAFYAKSHHAGLIQVADVAAAVFHRYAELAEYGQAERYKGERGVIDARIAVLGPRLIPRAHRHPGRGGEAATWLNGLTPDAFRSLGP